MTRLSPARLLAYAAPALPLAALFLPMQVHLAPEWAASGRVDIGALGAVLIAVRLFDAITDPLMGWLSDRRVLGLGRRGWLLLSVPLILGGALALMRPPDGAGLLWFGGFLTLMTLGWTMASVPWLALGAELTPGYAERARVTVWRETAGLIGTVAALVLIALAGLPVLALELVAVLPVAAAWGALGLREPPAPRVRTPGPGALCGRFMRDPLFRRLLVAWLVNGAANGLPPALFLFYADAVLGVEEAAAGALLLVYFAAAIAGGWLWSRGARRIPKHRLWCLGMLGASAAFLPVLALGPGDVAAFAVVSAVTGLFLGADLALPPAIQADVADRETARSGARGTASAFALWAVASKAALALSGGLAFLALDAAGFQPGAQNAPAALSALSGLYAGAPVALKLIAVGIMWTFPLGPEAQADLRARIEAQG